MAEGFGAFAVGAVVGGLIGFGWAQSIYGKMLANYRGYCAEYRAMLDRHLKR